jgi:tRNA U55 pseudouridine synthase TruB
VRKIRYLTKTKKAGHAGTLDPLATGLDRMHRKIYKEDQ